jgi:hypothetical protein
MTKGKEKTYELVARANGNRYSMKLQKEKVWRHVESKPTPEYIPFATYQPHHLKTLKRGLKLFLQSTWPGYAKQTLKVHAEISTRN